MLKKSLFVFCIILNFTLVFSQETTNEILIPPPPPSLDIKGNGILIFPDDFDPQLADNTDFGVITPNNTITKTFTIKNPGSSNLLLSGNPIVRIVGADAANFAVSTMPDNDVDTFNSEETFLEIIFTPDSERTFEAIVEIESNHGFSEPIAHVYAFAIKAVASTTMSIEEATTIDKRIKVYQDATSNMVTVHTENSVSIKNIRVFDVSGKLIQTKKIESTVNDHKMNFSSFSNGVYFLSIETATSKVVKKIVI